LIPSVPQRMEENETPPRPAVSPMLCKSKASTPTAVWQSQMAKGATSNRELNRTSISLFGFRQTAEDPSGPFAILLRKTADGPIAVWLSPNG